MDFVYDMTWAEFQIRVFAYKRIDLYNWIKLRELMWTSYIAPHQNPKKMSKRKEQFLPLDIDNKTTNGVSQFQKDTFLKEFEKYQQLIKAK